MNKPLSKKQVAEKMGISSSTLQKLLNFTWYDELEKCGYNRNLKLLSPRMLQIIYNNWGFEPENDKK
jgi:transcriptional regulator with XRE-family HTH domain